MKKFPVIHYLLVFLLVFQLGAVPVLATEAGVSEEAEASSIDSSAPSEESTIPTQAISSENMGGDASVSAGCRSINAVNPLIDTNDLLIEDAGAALMYELNSGTLLYGYNIDQKMYPASVTKVMTCLIAIENGNMDDVVTVSESVVAARDPDGSNADLVEGEELTLRDLIFCLMVASANDAGHLISEHIAGSTDAFVEMMNAKAQELGCTNTHFANPHGLHDEDHYTTARDLAKIMLAALEHELFREAYSSKVYVVPATNKCEERRLLSTNYMIEKTLVDHYYDSRVIGGKTGFTTPAGRCLAAVSESGDMKLLTVVLGGNTDLNQYGVVVYGSFGVTGDLIDMGFDNYTTAQVLSENAVLSSFPVSGGENDTQAVVRDSISTVVPADMAVGQLRYEYLLDDGTLTAPIEAGQSLGLVRVWYQAKCLAQREIYASVASPVKETVMATDPAISNDVVEQESNLWQYVLIAILVLLVIIVIMLSISMLRANMLRAQRRRRRNQAAKGKNSQNTHRRRER